MSWVWGFPTSTVLCSLLGGVFIEAYAPTKDSSVQTAFKGVSLSVHQDINEQLALSLMPGLFIPFDFQILLLDPTGAAPSTATLDCNVLPAAGLPPWSPQHFPYFGWAGMALSSPVPFFPVLWTVSGILLQASLTSSQFLSPSCPSSLKLILLAPLHFTELSLKYLLPVYLSLFHHALKSKQILSLAACLFLPVTQGYLFPCHQHPPCSVSGPQVLL